MLAAVATATREVTLPRQGDVMAMCDGNGARVYVANNAGVLRLQWALIVRLVLRVNWWRVLEGVEESLALLEMT